RPGRPANSPVRASGRRPLDRSAARTSPSGPRGCARGYSRVSGGRARRLPRAPRRLLTCESRPDRTGGGSCRPGPGGAAFIARTDCEGSSRMRTFDKAAAGTYLVDRVEVARWEQYSLGDRLPFQAMWYTVPPDSSSPRDCHPEPELSLVVSGTAAVETGGTVTDMPPGPSFPLDTEEAHEMQNRCAGQPLG